MVTIPEPIRHVIHLGRRVVGQVQVRKLAVTGSAPTAVVVALRRALSGRPDLNEAAWVERVERVRASLASSADVFELEDFGAGRSATFDDGAVSIVHRETRTIGSMTSHSKPPRWAYLLFRLTRDLKPSSAVELGACVGISACYQAAAMELNARGHLTTLEGSEPLAQRTARSLQDLQLADRATVVQGRFSDNLDRVLEEMPPVEMAFIDGHHIEQATLDYMEQILRSAGPECLLVFDDIHWSTGMRSAWKRIVYDDRFALTVEMRDLGLAVRSESATTRAAAALSYS